MGKAYYLSETDDFKKFVDSFNSLKYSKPIVIAENCAELNDLIQGFYPEIIKSECPFLNPTDKTPSDTIIQSLQVIVEKNDDFTLGFQTHISGMALLNLVYIYVLIGETRHLRIIESETQRVGFMKIGQSKIISAKTYDSHGLIALIDMLQWQSGSVEDENREIVYEPIDGVHIDGPQALMHAVHAIDEGNAQPNPGLPIQPTNSLA